MHHCMRHLKWLMVRPNALRFWSRCAVCASLIFGLVFATTQVVAAPVTVEIVKTQQGYALYRDGEPFAIRGAGMMIDDLARFKAHGGNAIRTWTTSVDDFDIPALLDRAHELGIGVALNLWLKHDRHGFDYNDEQAVQAQFDDLSQDVIKYKDHPALLFWIIGNELNHSYSNPRVWDAVEHLAQFIDEVDPHHPTTTAVAGMSAEVIQAIQERAPSLDFLSFQTYGTLFSVPDLVAQIGFDQPFMITEWGTIGWWEMETTYWGAPVELTSSEKAQVVLRGYEEVMKPLAGQLIGDFVFFWGQKQERTPTWFGVLTAQGEVTETADVLQYKWTGQWPAPSTPKVRSMTLSKLTSRDNVVLLAGQSTTATIDVAYANPDELTYHWEVKPESMATQSGGDFEEAIAGLDHAIVSTSGGNAEIRVEARGAYRLFVRVTDMHGRAAHANIPFFVEDGFQQAQEDLVAEAVMAVAYSGFREGQHPDRGAGAVNPSPDEVLEDLQLLIAEGFSLIRVYDSGQMSRVVLELIRAHELPLKVMLGIWLSAELSNHEGCEWLDQPIPQDELMANRLANNAEVLKAIELANEFPDIVAAVNVGNEALVGWTDHLMPLERVIGFVNQVQQAIEQPVTVAENYDWWARHGASLAAEVDFIGVHTYPVWEGRGIDEGLSYTVENLMAVRKAIGDVPMAVLEAGWATTASEFGERASESAQARYFDELSQWARQANVTVFFFSAFDEPWKGNPTNPMGAEKHWGLFFESRKPKQTLQ